jgi:branched-chain amino acid transport system substrate-binding protein
LLIAAVGGPAVLPQATLREQGFKGTIYQTHAVATDDFIKLGKDKVEGTILAAGPMLVIDEIPDTNPTKKVAQAYIAAYEKQFGMKPATFGANTWDAGILLERAIPLALRAAKPGTEAFRSALRDALEQEREVVGCQGVFNMSPTNHNGMDERARVLITIRDGRFRLLSQ